MTRTRESFADVISESRAALERLRAMAPAETVDAEFGALHRQAIDGRDREFFDRYYRACREAELWQAQEGGALSIYEQASFASDAIHFSYQVGGCAADGDEPIAARAIDNESLSLRERIYHAKVLEFFRRPA